MQIVEHTPDRLVLRQSPWIVRSVGIVATIGAVLVLGAMIVAGERGNRELWVAALGVFSIIACGGLAGMLVAVDRRIVFDRGAQTAQLIQTGGFKRAHMTQVQFS
jgi:hypothetical protein